jgi:protoporphyrinogen/coproporphyrinogen III oxidase
MTLADPSPSVPGASSPPAPSGGGDADVDVLIIGSGVSASSLAHTLVKDSPGLRVLMTEARDVVGGNVISREEGGYIWEEGPNTFQPAAHIMRLAVDVGLKDEVVLADHSLPRFVYWDKKLFALPMGPQDIPTFRLLSIPGAIRAGLGAAGFVLPNFSGKEETIKEFITRHLGAEVFAKMIDPFVSGVYAGNPAKLSMSAAFKKIFALQELGGTAGIVEGAIIRIGQKKRDEPPIDPELPTWKGGALGSFRKGLGMLPKAVAAKLGSDRVRLGWKLTSLQRTKSCLYTAIYETPDGPKTLTAKTIALTAPAGAAATILSEIAPEAKVLEDIHYPCVWSVTLAYPKSEFKEPLKGFGNLIPRSMGVRTLGCIWSSCLFPGRAPKGMELLLSYIGGAQDPEIAHLSEEEIVAAVDENIKDILLTTGTTVKPTVVGVRKWPRAIPQYNVGYFDIMDKVRRALKDSPGVFLGGNYTSGVAFGDCVQWGLDAAQEIEQFIETGQRVV